MPSGKNEARLLSALLPLVRQHSDAILGLSSDELRSLDLAVSGPLHHKGDRHHRLVTATYEADGIAGRQQIWVKFREDFRSLYDIQMESWRKAREHGLFPQPYFFADLGTESLIGMEMVSGRLLRNLVLRRVACRRARSLRGIFEMLGAGLRAFHDSWTPVGSRSAGELIENACRVTIETPYLGPSERAAVLAHLRAADEEVGEHVSLPLIKIHHDCSLRNVVVRDGGRPCLVDLDSMRAPADSRWYDVTTLLISMESQTKYRPVVAARDMVRLWSDFWSGYAGPGPPDALSADVIDRLLYAVKVEYLFGGTFRPPLFEVFSDRLATRFLSQLRKSVVDGASRMARAEG